MKRIAVLLPVLLLLLGTCAFALNGADYPAWDGASPAQNSICGDFGGSRLRLEFDPSAQYSNISAGTLQACFFAFDAAEENYLEMYLQMPDDVAAGDVLTSEKGIALTSVTLYEVAESFEDIYFAGQFAGLAYPQGSSYEIRIEEANRGADKLSVRGSLNAVLYKFDANDRPTGEIFRLSGVQFHFEMSLGGTAAPPAAPGASAMPDPTAAPEASAVPENSVAPEASSGPVFTLPPQLVPYFATPTPRPTMDPHPAFTLPPDYRVI